MNKQRFVDFWGVYPALYSQFLCLDLTVKPSGLHRSGFFFFILLLFISLFILTVFTRREKKTKWLQVLMKIRAIHHYLLGMKKIHNNVI